MCQRKHVNTWWKLYSLVAMVNPDVASRGGRVDQSGTDKVVARPSQSRVANVFSNTVFLVRVRSFSWTVPCPTPPLAAAST